MFATYFKYFFFYILKAKNRQRLLILAIVGLFLSSFSLIVLQSTMGGLQHKLMERSKAVLGLGTIYLKHAQNDGDLNVLTNLLTQQKINFTKEYEIEVLLRYQTFMSPVIVHGFDQSGFLPEKLRSKNTFGDQHYDAIMPLDLAYKIGVAPPENLNLISPAHVDSMLGDIPRSQSVRVDHTFSTDVPEIDLFHIWVRLPLIHNLIQDRLINRIRLYGSQSGEIDLLKIKKLLPEHMTLKSWEEENKTLVWALRLESTVMIFLFAAMSLLVSLCISSGLLIFFNKVKTDLASFWILGASFRKISDATTLFLHLMSAGSILVGLISGLIFLYFFDLLAPEIMPDMFVDRRIPIYVTLKGLAISFLVPYLISSVFVIFAIKQFKKEHDMLDHVKSVS